MDLLRGLKVLELSGGIKAGYCAKLFTDCGAEVIKLALPGEQTSEAHRIWLDPGKASVMIDWRLPAGAQLLERLAQTADVIVTDDQTRGATDLIAEWIDMAPRLVLVSMTDVGESGPLAGLATSDLVVSALSGMARINGSVNRLPLREPGNQTAIVGAFGAFIGALAAITNRSKTGRGQTVHASALEAMVNVLSPSVLQCSYQGGGPARRQSADGFLFDCADGKVSIIVSSERSWETMVELWSLHVEPDDPKLGTEGARRVNMPAVRELFAPVLQNKTRREVFEELCSVRVPCGMLMQPWELANDPHMRDRTSFSTVQSRDGEPAHALPGPSFRVAFSQPVGASSLARPGEDTARVLAPLADQAVAS